MPTYIGIILSVAIGIENIIFAFAVWFAASSIKGKSTPTQEEVLPIYVLILVIILLAVRWLIATRMASASLRFSMEQEIKKE